MEIEFSGEFTKDESGLVTEVAKASVDRACSLLSLPFVKFRIFIDDSQAIPAWGVGGYCENSQQIDIALSPGRKNDWKNHLPRTIAHEWHHLARWRGPGYGKTLAEVVISEGLAQHFEVDCFPGPASFFSSFLKGEERSEILAAFIREFGSVEFDHARWFFGKGEFPFQAGYDLSFSLIGEYLSKEKSLAANEVGLSPDKLRKSLPGTFSIRRP